MSAQKRKKEMPKALGSYTCLYFYMSFINLLGGKIGFL